MKFDYGTMAIVVGYIVVGFCSPILWAIGLVSDCMAGDVINAGISLGFPPWGVARGAMFVVGRVDI